MHSAATFRELVSGRWQGWLPSLLRGCLATLEPVYNFAVRRRNARYDSGRSPITKLPCRVISVGNLTVGGTGKTPFVAWLANWWLARGESITIISRGYGANNGRPNDEALELAARLPSVPHLQNADRVVAARQALAANPNQALILDDAFQHRRLARNLDIVLIDALDPFGHGHLLPRGLLREPLASLSRAHVVALSRSDAVTEPRRREIEAVVRQHAPQALWIELTHLPTRLISTAGDSLEISSLSDQPIAAFCGIGNPAAFRRTLEGCGLNVIELLDFSDHCPYGERDLLRLRNWLEPLDVTAAICTRKDLVKIPHAKLAGKKLFALEIEMQIARGQGELEQLLENLPL